MPLLLVRNDITKMQVDAIVNAAKNSLAGGGGVDGCIHAAAGPRLLEECLTLGGCATGDAKITGAYELPCRYVIHTVGPVYRDGKHGERDALASCYRRSLELAAAHHCETVAFPLISAGIFGYPKAEAMQVATETIRAFLETSEMTVCLVLFGHRSLELGKALFREVREYIDDHYTEPYEKRSRFRGMRNDTVGSADYDEIYCAPKMSMPIMADEGIFEKSGDPFKTDESFTQMLLRKIDEKGMSDVACYKKANIDRKLFSKIRSDIHYNPKKTTAIAFAIALELDLSETQELLMKAGYALSRSYKFDLIIEYFIRQGNYDLFAINEVLFEYDQNLLGA